MLTSWSILRMSQTYIHRNSYQMDTELVLLFSNRQSFSFNAFSICIPYSPAFTWMHLYTKPPSEPVDSYISAWTNLFGDKCVHQSLKLSEKSSVNRRTHQCDFIIDTHRKWGKTIFIETRSQDDESYCKFESFSLDFFFFCYIALQRKPDLWSSTVACTYIPNGSFFIKTKNGKSWLTFGACTTAPISYISACTQMRGNRVIFDV